MDRLTFYDKTNGRIGGTGDTETYKGRLYDYEESGLTPQEVYRLKSDNTKYKGVGKKYEAEITRLESLMMRKDEKIADMGEEIRLMRKKLEGAEEENRKQAGEGSACVAEAALFAMSVAMAAMAWHEPADMLLGVYWTMLAGYWGVAIARKMMK